MGEAYSHMRVTMRHDGSPQGAQADLIGEDSAARQEPPESWLQMPQDLTLSLPTKALSTF